MILYIYTIIHTLISLAAIFAGLVVLFAMLSGSHAKGWTKWFLITAVATTVTGFFFPFHSVTPAIVLGLITVPVLAITIFARYSRRLAGAWRWIYVVGAVMTLYFNLFCWSCSCFKKFRRYMQSLRLKPSHLSNSRNSQFSWCPSCWESSR
jgi:hypothetical protein